MANKLTLEQKIAKKEKDLALLKERVRKAENGQKIIIGGMMLSIAKKDPIRAKQLLQDIENEVTRKTDLDRLDSVIKELNEVISKATNEQEPQHNQNHY